MSAATIPHFDFRSLNEFPPERIEQLVKSASLEVRELLTIVAQLAWVMDAQQRRIEVLESLAGPRRAAKEHRRAERAEAASGMNEICGRCWATGCHCRAEGQVQ